MLYFQGNRGWRRDIWNETSKYQAALSAVENYTSPDQSDVIDETTWTESQRDKYVSRSQGFFIPPSDNEFQFYVKADDSAELHLSSNDDPAQTVSILHQNIW